MELEEHWYLIASPRWTKESLNHLRGELKKQDLTIRINRQTRRVEICDPHFNELPLGHLENHKNQGGDCLADCGRVFLYNHQNEYRALVRNRLGTFLALYDPRAAD